MTNTNALFSGTSGPHDADILIVGESYGSTETRKQSPFCGQSGEMLNKILSECGINRTEVFCTNVINAQPPGNNMYKFFYPTKEARSDNHLLLRGLYPRDLILEGLDKLFEQIKTISPKVVIGFGNYTLWALTSDSFNVGNEKGYKIPTGIGAWRGSQLYIRDTKTPFMPTYHPAAAMRNWPWRYAIKHDIARRMPKVLRNEWKEPPNDFIIRPSYEETIKFIVSLVACLKTNPFVDISIDIETRYNHIACVGIGYGFNTTPIICIPFMTMKENTDGKWEMKDYWTLDEEAIILANLCYIFTHPNARLIGQNFLFDAQYFSKWWGITVKCSFDTMLMHHVCWPGTPMGLNYLSSMYCNYHRNWKDEGKIGEHEEWGADVPEEILWKYNCKDVQITAEVKYVLEDLIIQLNLTEQAYTRMSNFDMLLFMQTKGIKINTKTRAKISLELMEAIDDRIEFLNYVIPPDVLPIKPKAQPWTGSPQQQAELFYDTLGIKAPRNRSVDDENLERIGRIEPILYPITTCLQELRSLRVFNNNFCKARLDSGDRLRCSYNPTAKTFRYKSSKNAFGTGTNLQNIPEGSEEG